MSIEKYPIIHMGALTEYTFYMAAVQFSETYGKFGMANDKLYVNQTDKICAWMLPDPSAVTNLSYLSPIGASTSSVPEFDSGSLWECFTVLKS